MNFMALTSSEIPEKKYSCKEQVDTEPETEADTEPDIELDTQSLTQADTQSVTQTDTQMKSALTKPKFEFNSKSKAGLEHKIPKQTIYERGFFDDKTDSYEYKTDPEDSIVTADSKQVESKCNEIHPDQSLRDDSEHNKNFIAITSSNLLRKIRVAGTQFARLLLSYFLIHLQSTIGISTLPNVVLESQKLRDSLCLRMTSPSIFFAASGGETEKRLN